MATAIAVAAVAKAIKKVVNFIVGCLVVEVLI
jgi:hypothetical protein